MEPRLKPCIDSRKNLLNSNISSACPHNNWPTNGWHRLASLGHTSKFQRVSRLVLASLLHRRRSTEVNQTLHDVWPSHGLGWYIIYTIRRLLPLNEILPGAKFTLRPSFVFLANVNSSSRSLFAVARPSICLSVCRLFCL